MTLLDEAFVLARQHVAWARQAGHSPDTILISMHERVPVNNDWDYVVGRLASGWVKLYDQPAPRARPIRNKSPALAGEAGWEGVVFSDGAE